MKVPLGKSLQPCIEQAQDIGLAIPMPDERIYPDARAIVDPEAVERMCRVWAEAGRAILARRSRVTI